AARWASSPCYLILSAPDRNCFISATSMGRYRYWTHGMSLLLIASYQASRAAYSRRLGSI
ncbi:hypothetical protein Dimus_024118, partial [Dionaea muscipula]